MERQRNGESRGQLNAAIYNLADGILKDFGSPIHTHTGNSRGVETTFHNTRDLRGFSNIRLASSKLGKEIRVIVIRQYFNERGNRRALRREFDLSSEGIQRTRAFDGNPAAEGVYLYVRTFEAGRINLASLNRWLADAKKELQTKKEQKKPLNTEEQRMLLLKKVSESLSTATEKKERIMWEKAARRKKIR